VIPAEVTPGPVETSPPVTEPVEVPSTLAALTPARVELSRDIVARFQPDSIRAESIRAIRTYLIAQHLHEGRRALAVCAASEGVGCTFVAANLAYVLAQAGVNTLLIDGDLRDPSIDRMYAPAQRHAGLAQCLAVRDDNFGDYITPGVAPNLSVLYSGGAADQPQELLAGAHFKALMDFCLREYDFTIIDTPPANLCADGRRICTVAGYAIIVAAKDLTFAEDVKTLASQIEGDHARVVGTVLNQA
jgi:capsular exopolysaccharide synthesis family protein